MVEKVNEISHIRKLEIHIETTEDVIENSNTQQHIEELLNQDLKLHKESISEINHLATENARLREALEKMPKHKCRNCNGDGFTSEHNCNGIESICEVTCPVQVQCEDCHADYADERISIWSNDR